MLLVLFLQIRVVKAFQAGLDRREPSLSGQSAARLREIGRQLKLQEHDGTRSGARTSRQWKLTESTSPV
uniref:ATP_Ca_trans_C domain-containing protein n=1 Tax=Syphacia muris TaxID=451379 RepID=A0A0N5A9H3_9BILA